MESQAAGPASGEDSKNKKTFAAAKGFCFRCYPHPQLPGRLKAEGGSAIAIDNMVLHPFGLFSFAILTRSCLEG